MTNERAEKAREARLRRAARRQGLRVEKARVRDPNALDWGTYQVIDATTNGLLCTGLPDGFGLDLDEVEQFLNGDGL